MAPTPVVVITGFFFAFVCSRIVVNKLSKVSFSFLYSSFPTTGTGEAVQAVEAGTGEAVEAVEAVGVDGAEVDVMDGAGGAGGAG